MKPRIVAAIERIAGDRLTPDMREEIADEAIRIIGEVNRAAALAAVENVKQTLASQAELDPTKP